MQKTSNLSLKQIPQKKEYTRKHGHDYSQGCTKSIRSFVPDADLK